MSFSTRPFGISGFAGCGKTSLFELVTGSEPDHAAGLKGQLGCPHDYEVFRSLLTPLIERTHEGATHHVGKVPTTADATVQKQTGLLKLRRELQEAVEQENYERAARLRDEISILETTEGK